MQGNGTRGQGLLTGTGIPEKGWENTLRSSWEGLQRSGKQRENGALFSVSASPTEAPPHSASSDAQPASSRLRNRQHLRPSASAAPRRTAVTVTAYREGQTSAKQTGKPECKSDDPKSPAGTSSECGTDRGSENKRHPQCEEKNDKRTVHAYLSGRSRTFEGKRKGSLLPGISRSYLGAPRRAPPHLYQGSLSFYGESPLLAKLRGGAVCRF